MRFFSADWNGRPVRELTEAEFLQGVARSNAAAAKAQDKAVQDSEHERIWREHFAK